MLQALFFERNPAVPAAGFFYQIPDKDHSNKLAFFIKRTPNHYQNSIRFLQQRRNPRQKLP